MTAGYVTALTVSHISYNSYNESTCMISDWLVVVSLLICAQLLCETWRLERYTIVTITMTDFQVIQGRL